MGKHQNIDSGYTTRKAEHTRLTNSWLAQYPPTTQDSYARALRQFSEWAQLDNPLKATRPLIQDWLKHLTATGLAAPTIRNKASALSSFYNYAAEEGAITANVARYTRRPRGGDGIRLGLPVDQARAVLQTAHQTSPTAHALVTLLMIAGLRISEAVKADITDLDTDAGKPVLEVTRKGGHSQRIPLPTLVADAVETAAGTRTDGPLLAGPRGGRLTRHRAAQLVQQIGEQAGIPGLYPHLLRHTCATNMLRQGIPVEKVQQVLGHRSIATTMRYVRALNQLDTTPGETLAAALTGEPR